MKNRFANYGNTMKGDSYVHRNKLEKQLLDRTVNYDDYGSVNVVGLQRMGKSSLVYNALEAKADEFYEKNVVIAKISANEIPTNEIPTTEPKPNPADKFFKDMVQEVFEVMKEHNDVDEILQKRYEEFKNDDIVKEGSFSLRKFFKRIKKSDKRVVMIIDEFDYSAKIFSDFPEGFNILRQLAYEPETHVAFIFVSRRRAEYLERKCEGISPFHNILDYVYVKGFSDEELEEYFKCCEKSGVTLDDKERETLKSITGGQPYWSDIMLKAYKEEKENNENTDLETVFHKNIDKFHGKYGGFQHTLDLLEEQGLLNKLYQIVFGPMEPDCTRSDIQTLYNYGIIVDKDKSTVISDKFYDYLKSKEREVDFYPLWHETETGLRKILKNKLKIKEEYKPDWERHLIESYLLNDPKELMKLLEIHFFKNHMENDYILQSQDSKRPYSKKDYYLSYDLDEAIKQKNRMLNNKICYDSNKDITIVEALYTKGLFLLYDFEYSKLQLDKIFGDKDKFVEKSIHLSKARNPYQHNNEELLNDDYKKKTKEYCEALYNSIRAFLENQK